jgi:predicted dehydrogenase
MEIDSPRRPTKIESAAGEVKVILGVVGCGRLGSLHARVYTQIPGVELGGVFDIDPAAAQAVASRHGCRAFESLAALAREADALSICVPTPAHREVALTAAAAGCHLLVEKPIAEDLAGAEAMLAAMRASGRQLMVGHVERFNPAILAAMPLFQSPGFVESHRLAPFTHRGADVPVVLDLMIHDIDLLAMIINDEVQTLDASGVSVLGDDVDIANARLRFSGGCVANITASRISRERLRKIRFFQADSYLSVDLLAGHVEMMRKVPGFGERLAAAKASPAGLAGFKMEELVESVSLPVESAEPLRLELEAFVRAIERDEPVPVTGEDGLRALRLALAIMDKVRDGR